MADKPLLIRAANAVDRAVGRPLESLADSRRFVDVVTLAVRAERVAQGVFERRTRSFLHFWNVPAGTDIKRLTLQIAALGTDVREMQARLQDELELLREQAREREKGTV